MVRVCRRWICLLYTSSPTTAEHVKEDLWGRIDMIIDGGLVGIGVESTIIDVTEETPTILRPGHITKNMIAKVIGTVQMDAGLSGLDQSVKPKACLLYTSRCV